MSSGGPVLSARILAICGLAVTTAACAIGVRAGDTPEASDAATESSDAGTSSSSSSSSSTSSSSTSSSTSSSGSTSSTGGTDAGKDVAQVQPSGCTTLVINEVQTAGDGGAADEFVEIYNPNGNPCSLNTWKLVYRSSSGTSDVVLYSGTAAAPSIPADGYVVLGGSSFTGASQGSLTNSMAGSGGGQLALKDASSAIADSLGYGNASGAFVRGSAAPLPAAGKSIARTPNGKDTKNNQADFTVVSSPTPGQKN